MTTPKTSLVLASQSPRRADLLRDAGYEFSVFSVPVDELHDENESIVDLTVANARLKAEATSRHKRAEGAVVLAADTLVSIDQVALTKPTDREEAHAMLSKLSGRVHQVSTACVVVEPGGEKQEFVVMTDVEFLPLNGAQIDAYLELINPLDKAGGYAAQEHGEKIIKSFNGSYSNVVGLPMEEVERRLERLKIYPLNSTQ